MYSQVVYHAEWSIWCIAAVLLFRNTNAPASSTKLCRINEMKKFCLTARVRVAPRIYFGTIIWFHSCYSATYFLLHEACRSFVCLIDVKLCEEIITYRRNVTKNAITRFFLFISFLSSSSNAAYWNCVKYFSIYLSNLILHRVYLLIPTHIFYFLLSAQDFSTAKCATAISFLLKPSQFSPSRCTSR